MNRFVVRTDFDNGFDFAVKMFDFATDSLSTIEGQFVVVHFDFAMPIVETVEKRNLERMEIVDTNLSNYCASMMYQDFAHNHNRKHNTGIEIDSSLRNMDS